MSLIGHNMTRTKSTNKSLVLQSLLRYGPISRQQIAEITQLTPATITNLTRELIKEGLVQEIGSLQEEKKRAGRKSISLDLKDNLLWVIGIFVHRTKIEIGLVNLKGRVKKSKEIHLAPNLPQDDFLQLLVMEIELYLQEYKQYRILAIGIGIMGRVNFEQGILLHEENLHWHNLEISRLLTERFDLPVYVDNDARTMTLAEKLYGSSKTENDLLYVFIGTGIGAGLVMSNQIYRGGANGALQFGHMTYMPDGERCWCGNRGCIEQYASIPALLKDLNLSEVEFLEKITLKDPEVLNALNLAGQRIGIVLTSFLNLLHVEKVIVSGKIADESLPLIHSIRETVYQRSFLAKEERIEIETSKIKQHVGLIGAASLALYYEVFQKDI